MLFAQVTIDYSKQLDEIVKAMNRPTTPVWIVALFSAFLGFIGGIFGMLATDLYRGFKLRRVLYLDLVGMFWAVKNIMAEIDVPEFGRQRWQREQLNKALLFYGEKYCLDNPEVYIQLSERGAGETLYSYFHQILDDEKWLGVNTNLALNVFADFVHDGTLKPMYLRLFLGRKGAGELRQLAEHRYKRNEEYLKRMGESDQVETRPDEESE